MEFYVVMQRRQDGVVYPDLHKTDGQFYLTLEDAELALANKPLSSFFHVVKLIALVETPDTQE